MAINLKVKVKSDNILDALRLLQASGRQKLLEKESNNKLEVKGRDARAASFSKQGLDPQGQDQAGTKRQKLSTDEEPTAYRFGNNAGVSVAWRFSRLKEQPTIFNAGTPRIFDYGCSPGYPVNISSAWYSKRFSTYRIYCGDGSQFYEYDVGYDLTDVWTPAPDLPNPGIIDGANTPVRPTRNIFGQIRPEFPDVPLPGSPSGDLRLTNHEYFFPVGEKMLLFYYYSKAQRAFQIVNSQQFYKCSPSVDSNGFPVTSTPIIQSHTVTEAPFEVVSVDEHCLLIGEDFIKVITPPTAVRDYFNDRSPTYKMVPATGYVNPESGYMFNGVRFGPVYYTGYMWEETPPKIQPPTDWGLFNFPYNSSREKGFSATLPLPGSKLSALNSFTTGYYITTSGGYESLVGSTSVDYDKVYEKTPSATNVNDPTGFLSGESWEAIFDNSTELKFEASLGTKKYKTPSIKMRQAIRPQDSVTYTTPEGFELTADWNEQIVIGYDWANPQFCKSQLMAMGFSASDLARNL